MMTEKHGHKHHGKTSKDILGAEEVLNVVNLRSGDKFLDAGCGDGYISIAASKIVGSDGKIFALDVYPESINNLKQDIENRKLTNIEAILSDITQSIPLNEAAVDSVLMANVLHGFVEEDDVEPVIKNIFKVLKRGGIFSVVEFRKIQTERGPPFDVRLNPSDVSEILQKYGFDVVDSVEIGKYHYIVKGQKTA